MKHFFLSRLWRHRRLIPYCLEIWLDLLICKFLISIFRHQRWGLSAYCFQCETLKQLPERSNNCLSVIQRALPLTVKCLFWRSRCLDQALAAQRLLTRRHLPSTLYLGMIKNESGQWTAHAWVRCGSIWIVGYQPNQAYAVVATYAKIFHENQR